MPSLYSACSNWKAITRDSRESLALLAAAAHTVSHSHMEAFCFPSHAPSGLTKVATTTYTAFGTSFSVFYKAAPLKGPISNTAKPNLINSNIKEGSNCEHKSLTSISKHIECHGKLRQTEYKLDVFSSIVTLGSGTVHHYLATCSWMCKSKHFAIMEYCNGISSGCWRAT